MYTPGAISPRRDYYRSYYLNVVVPKRKAQRREPIPIPFVPMSQIKPGVDGPLGHPEHGLGHLDRAPSRTFEECWQRARDKARRVSVQHSMNMQTCTRARYIQGKHYVCSNTHRGKDAQARKLRRWLLDAQLSPVLKFPST